MKHIRAYLYIIGVTLMVAVMAACSVSYKFNGASIDYTKTKTIQDVYKRQGQHNIRSC